MTRLKLKNIFKHLTLVIRHKNRVFINCCKCGIPLRGFLHDLSKFSPTEFFESARYYQGNRSPITMARRENGISVAWLHHKGRNKHHIEYWLDADCEVTPMMPYKYAVECVCDKLAATKVYAKAKGYYDNSMPLEHWLRYGNKVNGNQRTMLFIEAVFRGIIEKGEKAVLNKRYMKDLYRRICIDGEIPKFKENEN